MTALEARALWNDFVLVRASRTFKMVERVHDPSRDGLGLRRCQECGLLYAGDLHEGETWSGGADAMHSTYVPMRDVAHVARLRGAPRMGGFAADVPRLQQDSVAGRSGRLQWMR